jgi:TRAP transporter TAXI family solute receptor
MRIVPLLPIALIVGVITCLPLGCNQEARRDISIGTGGTGGVYYPFGGGLAEIWSRHVPGVRVVAEVTGASVENVKLAHRGETVIGEIMGDVAHQAYYGTGKFEGDPQRILALAVMYPSIMHVVTLENSAVKTIDDLKGHTVSIGAPGSGTAYMSDLVLRALGIDLDATAASTSASGSSPLPEARSWISPRRMESGWCPSVRSSSTRSLKTMASIRRSTCQPGSTEVLNPRWPR